MTVRRDLTISGKDPVTHVPDIDDTVNYHSGLLLGQLSSVSDSGGADTLTGNLRESNGFTNGTLKAGATVKLIAPSDCIGPSTIAINGEAALAIVAKDGDDLVADAWAEDDLLELVYEADGDEWRLVAPQASSSSSSSAPAFYPHVYAFTENGTLTFSADADVYIICLGAGGSGGVAVHASNARGQGGNDGALSKLSASVLSAAVLTVTVGVGGARKYRFQSGSTNGDAGGSSSVSGTGISVTSNGGAGGQAATSGTVAQQSAATASGGDENHDGGSAGSLTSVGATGGAGRNPFGTGRDSGNNTSSSATAGASPANDGTNNSETAVAGFVGFDILWGILNITSSASGAGESSTGNGGDGGIFAGGGGLYSATNDRRAGDGGLGAGGGGCAMQTAGELDGYSGAGGNGRVWIFSTQPATQA